tara:strand:+ start:186 stop:293 length:108 start_codon:yes stop_codon:yes gene_type:complete
MLKTQQAYIEALNDPNHKGLMDESLDDLDDDVDFA